MVDVSSQSNKVNITVSSSGVSSNVNASGDTSHYYSEKAREWAISNRIVDGVDYSSKYYAEKSNQSALNAQSFAQSAQDSYKQFQSSVDGALSNIDSSVQGAIDEINNTKTDIITDIEFVTDGEKKEIEDLIDSGKDELKEAIGDVKVLTTLEIGDIGFTQMSIDESKGKRRVLNGQLIIQEQYVQFTNIIKNSVALNPDLACTEEEWQTTVTMSAYGLCDKFVIDDEAGTIRLPKYPNYFIGGVDVPTGDIPVAGSGISLGFTDGTRNFGTTELNGSTYMCTATGAYGKTVGSSQSYSDSNASKVIGVTTDPAKSGITAKLSNDQSEQIKGTYFIQVATGAETEDNIVNALELNNPYVLLEPKFFGTEVYNISWLLANGTYNGSNATHPSAYQALVVENNAEVAIGSTVTLPIGTEYTKRGLSVKLSTDNDITDYDFVLNTADETFRLPIKVKLASGKAVVGNGMTLGLMGSNNATSGLYMGGTAEVGLTTRVASYGSETGSGSASSTNLPAAVIGVTTDPNYSGIETSDSDLYLYFYVGETVQNANLINAGRIEEKVASLITDNSSLISGYGMPSSRYIDLELGASNSLYTAPANGWFALWGSISTQHYVVEMYCNSFVSSSRAHGVGTTVGVSCPASKGSQMKLYYDGFKEVNYFRFIYAEGEQ